MNFIPFLKSSVKPLAQVDDDQWSSCDEEDEVDHGNMDGSQDEVDVE